MAQENSQQVIIFNSIPSIYNQQATEAVRSVELSPVLFTEEDVAIEELEYSCLAVITAIRHNSIFLNVTGAKLLTAAHQVDVPRAILVPPELSWWVAEKVHLSERDVAIPLGRRRPRVEQGLIAWLSELSDKSD